MDVPWINTARGKGNKIHKVRNSTSAAVNSNQRMNVMAMKKKKKAKKAKKKS